MLPGALERKELLAELTTTNDSGEKTLPEAQQTQGIESVTFTFRTEISLKLFLLIRHCLEEISVYLRHNRQNFVCSLFKTPSLLIGTFTLQTFHIAFLSKLFIHPHIQEMKSLCVLC